ncbi:hypothetical protein D3C71_1175230 [compost metagenome]
MLNNSTALYFLLMELWMKHLFCQLRIVGIFHCNYSSLVGKETKVLWLHNHFLTVVLYWRYSGICIVWIRRQSRYPKHSNNYFWFFENYNHQSNQVDERQI